MKKSDICVNSACQSKGTCGHYQEPKTEFERNLARNRETCDGYYPKKKVEQSTIIELEKK